MLYWLALGALAIPTGRDSRAEGGIQGATMLAGLRDHARVLLVFSPTADDARLRTQLKIMRDDAAGATERDLVTIAVPEHGGQATETWLTAADAAVARRRFHLRAGELRVMLVGKDGGEKLRSGEPIPFERLRETIDAMPMRQQEMKSRR